LSKKLGDWQTVDKEQRADEHLRRQEATASIEGLNERRQLAIRALLQTVPAGVDEKLMTVKAAHHVDRERFQSAFVSLMKNRNP
tara:strand:- start:308 stop:559 length:252 start_codon:yes stop_codon:yes gene_type:complete